LKREIIMQVGDKLWWVSLLDYGNSGNKRGREVTITKVGRVYLTLSNGYRVFRDTLKVKSDYTTGVTVYFSELDHLTAHGRSEAWSSLRRLIDSKHTCPDHLSREEIDQAIELLSPPKV
jgi:hypothetical protein